MKVNVPARFASIPVLVFAVILLTSCGPNANSNNASSAEMYVSDCGYGYSQKPSSITLTCADGGMYIDKITYSSWTSESAEGSGIFSQNNCDPDCASGKFISTPVKIMISKPKSDVNGKLIFSELVMRAEKKLYTGTKSATFDIGIEPEINADTNSQDSNQNQQLDPEQATLDLIGRLNSKSELWEINEAATSSAGQFAHKQLGLYSEPDYVIECNLPLSGTWLFLYSDENAAYDAFNSDYFFRTSNYSAELMYDPSTNMLVILHTSMGGTRACLNSAYSQLDYYATD